MISPSCSGDVVEPDTGAITAAQAGKSSTVEPSKELFITDLTVLTDPKRVNFDGHGKAEWSFAHLISGLRGSDDPKKMSAFVLNWLHSWESEQIVNDQSVAARANVRALLVDPWKSASGCTGGDDTCVLDMSKAPFRLEAIVYRPDLRRVPTPLDPGWAGQGRFVFSALGPDGVPLSFDVIFEYLLPSTKKADIAGWAQDFHELGKTEFGPAFNAKLTKLTERFAAPNVMTGRPHGSALSQVRTNEAAFDPLWELREFVLSSDGERLVPDTVKNEPAAVHNGSPLLAAYTNEYEADVLAGAPMPNRYQGVPFLAGSALVPVRLQWVVGGANAAANKALALNTCSGCHRSETSTLFLHVMPAEVRARLSKLPPPTVRAPAVLSAFLQSELTGARSADFESLLQKPIDAIADGPAKEHGNGKGAARATTPPAL